PVAPHDPIRRRGPPGLPRRRARTAERNPIMPEPALRVAYEEADITPPLGGSMPGYFRDRLATGVLDPLRAKVLYLAQGGESVALVACDLIGMAAPLVQRIRRAVTKACERPPRHVWVHCTHTHTGGFVPRSDAFTSDAE